MADGRSLGAQPEARSEPHGGRLFNAASGAAMGGLVGLLIGLSAAPVVASAATAVLALLVTFFGFGGTVGALKVEASTARVLGFGLAMAAGLVGGILVRSHGLLGPTFAERVERFTAGSLDLARAQDLAIYEHLGLRTGHLLQVAPPAQPPPASPYAFSIRQDRADPNCANLDARHVPDPTDRLKAMAQSPAPWAEIGRSGLALPAGQHAEFAERAFRQRCGDSS